MAKMTPRTLSGFRELLPGPQQQMERIMEILRRTYSLYGFTPLDTPVIESSEVLLAKGGGEPSTTTTCPSPSAGTRSARSTGASGPSGAGSGSSTRRTST